MNNARSRMKQVRFRVNFHNSLGMGWGSPFFCTINWKADIPSSAVYIYAYSSYTPAKSEIDISFIAQLVGDYQGKLFCSVHKPKYHILRKKVKIIGIQMYVPEYQLLFLSVWPLFLISDGTTCWAISEPDCFECQWQIQKYNFIESKRL